MTHPPTTLHMMARAWFASIEARRPTRGFPPFSCPGRHYGWTYGGDATHDDETESFCAEWLLRRTKPNGEGDDRVLTMVGVQ